MRTLVIAAASCAACTSGTTLADYGPKVLALKTEINCMPVSPYKDPLSGPTMILSPPSGSSYYGPPGACPPALDDGARGYYWDTPFDGVELGGYHPTDDGDGAGCFQTMFFEPGCKAPPSEPETTFRIDDASTSAVVAVTGLADKAFSVGPLVAGQRATIQWQPTSDQVISATLYCESGSVPCDSDSTGLAVSGSAATFTVPAELAGQTIQFDIILEVQVPPSRCEGADECIVYAELERWLSLPVGP